MPEYLHQRDDWPNWTYDAMTLLPIVARTRSLQGRLLGRMDSLGLPLRRVAQLDAITDEVVHTSAIEGKNLPPREVRSSIARRLGLDAAGLPTPARAVDGIVEVMLDATHHADKPLTTERLFGWHGALFSTGYSDFDKIVVADWRDDALGPMQVVSGRYGNRKVHYEAPEAARVPGEMERFLAWYNTDPPGLEPVLRAALAHLWFVTIHPFEDGNGRIARAIGEAALTVADGSPQRFYSLSAEIYHDRTAYYEVLEKIQRAPSFDITEWFVWFLGSLERAIAHAEDITKRVLYRQQFRDNLPPGDYTPRQRAIIERLLDGFVGKFTSGKWAAISKVSVDTAHRDIQGLVALGVLEQEEAGGRSTSYRLVSPPKESPGSTIR